MGWRNQIDTLTTMGLRVVAPDLIGFGGTDAPLCPPESLSVYSHKSVANDIAALAHALDAPKIILGGHDWGGAVVYRTALWHPELVTHLIVICTPYMHPTPQNAFVTFEELKKRMPQFGYQEHLAGPDVEAAVKTPEQIRHFLNAVYGGRAPSRKPGIHPVHGVNLAELSTYGKTKLMSDREMDYYVQEYSRTGMHGPLNWYRIRYVNWKDERDLKQTRIDIPSLFIAGKKERILLPSLSAGMDQHMSRLTRAEVNTDHWAMLEDPEAVNAILVDWFKNNVILEKSKI